MYVCATWSVNSLQPRLPLHLSLCLPTFPLRSLRRFSPSFLRGSPPRLCYTITKFTATCTAATISTTIRTLGTIRRTGSALQMPRPVVEGMLVDVHPSRLIRIASDNLLETSPQLVSIVGPMIPLSTRCSITEDVSNGNSFILRRGD